MKPFLIINNIFWVLSAIGLSCLSMIYYRPSAPYTGGLSYILFYLVFILLVIINKKRVSANEKISPFVYLLGSVIIAITSEPLFENDHYRYLFEAKAFIKGLNPYLNPPTSLALQVDFSHYEHIGYRFLTSIYPPLALIILAPFSLLPYWAGLKLLMLFNAFLVYRLLVALKQYGASNFHLILFFPYFQKEFIQGVHIDLLAFIVFFHFLQGHATNKKIIGIIISFWIKLLALIALPFVYFSKINISFKRICQLALIIVLIVGTYLLFLHFVSGDLRRLIGPTRFYKVWVWNPGFYGLIHYFLGLEKALARLLSQASFSLVYIILLYRFVKMPLPERERSLPLYLNYVFASLCFFAPVYNGWYALWYAAFALVTRHRWGIIYGLCSAICYLPHGHINYLKLGFVLSHIPYLFILRDILKSRNIYNIKAVCNK